MSLPKLLFLVSDINTRRAIDGMLGGGDYELIFVEKIKQALQFLKESDPAIAIVDSYFDAIPSVEACYILRSVDNFRTTPILLLASVDEREIRSEALRAGAVDDFINKPLDGVELKTRIGVALQLSRHRSQLDAPERIRWMFEFSSEGMLKLDADGWILYANESARRYLNLPENFGDVKFTEHAQTIYQPHPLAIWEKWQTNPNICYLTLPENESTRAQWLVVDTLETVHGNETHRMVRLRDVTEKMTAYQDMRKFHTTVAHKLRTPISIMVTNLSVLKSQIEKLPPEEMREYVRGAIGGAERLVREVRDVLSYIDAPLSLEVGTPVPLADLTEFVVLGANALGIEDVFISLPQHLKSIKLKMTETALELIIEELFENAKKFHPNHQPKIEVSVAQMEQGFVRLRVTDNGQTLSAEQMAWAWLPYFQGEKDFSGEIPGMGLGLPLVATIVWQTGGSVHMTNRPDNQPGVVVALTIPTL